MVKVIKAKGLTTLALVLLITGSIDSIRNLPVTALFGSSLIFFFIFSAVVLLIPVALVSAELASTYTEHSGIYAWVKLAFGEKAGFFAIWLQWINTIVWYPTILSFIAGILAYLINPSLAQNKWYLIGVILIVFWGLTFLNLKGLRIAAWFTSFCVVLGFIIPLILIMTLAIIWILQHHPLQIQFNVHSIFPALNHAQNWISLTAIMTSFLGMELATVHVKKVDNPSKTFPRALFFSVLVILITMMAGSLAIAITLPHNQIQLVSGIMQEFSLFFKAYHLNWFVPVIALMLFMGSLGEMINWIISPARGLLEAGRNGYLPAIFLKENDKGVASNLLITQAILVSILCLIFLLMPSVNGFYWLLTDLSTQLYMIMYVFLFFSAWTIKLKMPILPNTFKIPGGKLGMLVVCLLGIMGSSITIVVGFFPPANINVGGVWHYETMFISGMLFMCLPAAGFYYYKYCSTRSLIEIPVGDLEEDPIN